MYEHKNCSITPWGKEPKMKYRRSGYAKYATLATLTLALTLAACAPSSPVASNSLTPTVEEAGAFVQLPVAPLVEVPAAQEPAADAATQGVSTQVVAAPQVAPAPIVEAPVVEAPQVAPAPVVEAPPVATAPPVAPTPPATIPPSNVAPSAPEAAPITPTEPSTPHVSPDFPVSGLYTFPDGHISFLLPAGWTAQTEETPLDLNGEHYETAKAHIHDETGIKVAEIDSGIYGGVVGGPVNRTILDSQPLTNFDSQRGAGYFAFFKDEYPFDTEYTRYFMGVVVDSLLTEGPDSTSASSFLIMGNGAAQATANIEVSMTPESAAAWMETEQYSKLKALLTSLQYAE